MVNANWLLILSLALPPGIETLNWTIGDGRMDLSEVTLFIAREHISKFTSTIVVAECSLEPETTIINTLLLDYLLIHLQGTIAVQFLISNYTSQPWEYYIFIVDSFEAFKVLRWRFSRNNYDRDFHFLVILTKYTSDFINVMEAIFRLCYEFDVINVNIIIDFPPLGVCMFTYGLFTNTGCRVVNPVLYLRFSQGFDHLKTLFPEKLANFYGCPMKVASRNLGPMMIFTGNTSNPKPIGRWENLSGFEGILLKLIAESLNFTIELQPFLDREGCFSELVTGAADVAIGSFSGSDPDRWILSPSKTYYQSPFVYIVRGGHSMGSMRRLATPFDYRVWILIVFLLISGTIIIQVVRFVQPSIRRFVFGERNDAPMMNFFAVLLGYPISRIPRRNFARFLLLMWLLVTLVLRNAYQGSLYDAIRLNKFVRTPSGVKDLINWNYKLIVSPEIPQLDMFPKNETAIIAEGTYAQRFEILESARSKYVTVTLKDNYEHYMGNAYRRSSDLIMINEVVYMYQMVMFFRKHSIYLSAFNKKLQAFSYSGITASIVNHINTYSTTLWKDLYAQKPTWTALTNKRLNAVYTIFALMTVVALLVFGLELLSVYSAKLRLIIECIN